MERNLTAMKFDFKPAAVKFVIAHKMTICRRARRLFLTPRASLAGF